MDVECCKRTSMDCCHDRLLKLMRLDLHAVMMFLVLFEAASLCCASHLPKLSVSHSRVTGPQPSSNLTSDSEPSRPIAI